MAVAARALAAPGLRGSRRALQVGAVAVASGLLVGFMVIWEAWQLSHAFVDDVNDPGEQAGSRFNAQFSTNWDGEDNSRPVFAATAISEVHRGTLQLNKGLVENGFGPLQAGAIGRPEMDSWHHGFGLKLESQLNMSRQLLGLNPNGLLLFVDGYDVMVLQSVEKLTRRFEASGADIVFSSEFKCSPDRDRAPLYAAGYERSGHVPASEMQYLNSGMYIGRPDAVRQLLEARPFSPLLASDQRYWTETFLTLLGDDSLDAVSPAERATMRGTGLRLALDEEGTMFGSASGRWSNKWAIGWDGVLRMKETGGDPCLFHLNGNGKKLYWMNAVRRWTDNPGLFFTFPELLLLLCAVASIAWGTKLVAGALGLGPRCSQRQYRRVSNKEAV